MKRKLLHASVPVLAFGLAASAVDLPVFSVGPGPVREVLPRIDVKGHRTYEPQGTLLLTTVSVRPLTVFDAVAAWLDPGRDVLREREVLGRGESVREYRRQSLSQMDESKIAAVAFALSETTDYPDDHGRGVLIQDVFAGLPAEGRLFPGETIVSIDGRPVREIEDVGRAVDRAGTTGTLRFTVEAGGPRASVSLRPQRPPGQTRPLIGVVLVESFPFEVTIRSGDDGGPSAGLMWALGVLDLLTPGSLTSGRTIAGTGEIDPLGNVFSIGSVAHKVRAAERRGADAFLLPRANLVEARAGGAKVPLVPVDTVQDALRYLERGGT